MSLRDEKIAFAKYWSARIQFKNDSEHFIKSKNTYKKQTTMNYEKDITIDETSLDLEWLDQPRLMMRYVRHAADMRKEMDEAKERLDNEQAELDKKVRSNPERYGIDKITETAVRNAVLSHERFKKVNEEYMEASYEHNMAQGAVRAIETKKTALENLVRLHGQQYFAGPKIPRDLHDEVTKRNKQDRADAVVQRPARKRRAE